MVARSPGRRAQQGKTMNDDRFEAWWPRNPARRGMNPVAKEVARGIWRAAREDMLVEMQAAVTRPQIAISGRTCWESASMRRPFETDVEAHAQASPPSENTPWYPDDSGEWVEIPDDCVTCPVLADTVVETLLRNERQNKRWTPWRGIAAGFYWDHKATEGERIVAYKMVKP